MLDGDGDPVPDALVETWQADPDGRFATRRPARPGRGLPRVRPLRDRRATAAYAFVTVKPGRCRRRRAVQAPHLDVSVFARGLLQRS